MAARAVPLIQKDGSLAAAEREEWSRACADRAMEGLREAVRKGLKDTGRLKTDPNSPPCAAATTSAS